MNDEQHIQAQLFQQIKERIPDNYSIVHEISELLNISYDSTYRRLRNEKAITLEEAFQLCKKFRISLDELASSNSNFLSFQCFQVEPENFIGLKWLDRILEDLKYIVQQDRKEMVYAAKDPPIFQYFQFPEIAAFKMFFWEKTLFHFYDDEKKKFKIGHIQDDIKEKCLKIAQYSNQIPTTEIWNEDTFRILIRQIEYYWVSGYFESKEDLELLLEKIEIWLAHNQKQAEYGMKFPYDAPNQGIENSYKLYENEIVINDNTIHITTNRSESVYLTFNVLGLLHSSNSTFCTSISKFQKALMSKSNLISQVGDKERNRFFNKLNDCIYEFKKNFEV
jgi:hypothetical protein